MREVKQYKVTTLLGNLPADSIFYLRETPESDVKVYITSRTGIPVPIKDLSGGVGITINNTDGNLAIVNGENTSINFSEEILSIINSALQTGDTVSTLINDAGYLTASDIPVSDEPYNSTTWNNVVDEAPSKNAVRDKIESLILSGGGGANLATIQTPTSVTITSDTGDDAEITLADGTNSGVSINNFTTAEKNKLNDIATNANVGVVPNAPITSSTKTKITYDTKGLVTAGADLVASDIPNIPQSKVDNLATDLGNKQNALSGTGFVKSTAGTISYDTNTYLTPTGSAAGLTSFPTLNQNTTGTAGGLSADIPQSRVTDLVSDLSNKQPLSAVLTTTTASFTTADETKLDGIATGANVGVVPNTAITGATKTKITYDAKGLVTAGVDASLNDLSDVNISSPTVNHILVYDGLGEFRNTLLTSSYISNFDSATRAQVEAELVAGSNIIITPSGSGATRQLTIASTSGGATPQTGHVIVTSGDSFTTPSNITINTVWYIELVGGGGGGGATSAASGANASGGGGGGYCYKRITGLNPSTTYTCAIGTGGSGGTAPSGSGGNGTTTNLDLGIITTFSASGGAGGTGGNSQSGGIGGTGSGGDIEIPGESGGGTGSAGSTLVNNGKGGSSPKGWGLGGAEVTNNSAGKNGTGYGGGGAGGHGNSVNGGSGANGMIYAVYFN